MGAMKLKNVFLLAFGWLVLLGAGCSPALRRGIADIVLDVACIVRNAELEDGDRERMCATGPTGAMGSSGATGASSKKATVGVEEGREIAREAREANRRFAASHANVAADAGTEPRRP